MIAVLAEDNERAVVREFFELFKTPWEFFDGASKCSVLVCTVGQIPANSAKLVIVYGSQENSFDRERGTKINSRRSGAIVLHGENRFPIYGNCLAFGVSEPASVTHDTAGEPVSVTVGCVGQTIVRIGFDLFREIEYLLTRGQPAAHAAIPTLELHIELLRSLIVRQSISLIEIPPVPDGHDFIACLTHDMDHIGIRNHKFDHTMFGFMYRATVGSVVEFFQGKKNRGQVATNWLAAVKLPLIYLGLARDFWSRPDRYLEIEKGLNSTFFVIPKKGEPGLDARGNRRHRRAASYDVAQHIDLLKDFQATGDEIGVHGIDAWRDSAAGREEKDTICRFTGTGQTGVRMHWLYFDEQAPAMLEAAGFSYDSTVGYNETIGYRAGTAQAFRPLTVQTLLELPMQVMDTALFYPSYLNLSPTQAQDAIRPLVFNASRFGGAFTVNWHDRSVVPERLWDVSYGELINQLRARHACFLTAGQAVSWFRKRRSAVFEQKGDSVIIKIAEGNDKTVPGLRVRTCRPDANGQQYSETLLNEGEIRVAA